MLFAIASIATDTSSLMRMNLIDAKVVQVDAANDLALLKADGRFAPLPIAASRTGLLGGTVATVGFPDIGLQGFALKLAGINAKTQRINGFCLAPLRFLSCVLCISWFTAIGFRLAMVVCIS
jgi:hypothetical protein